MNKKRVFFAGLLSSFVVGNFFAAQTTDTVKHFIPIFSTTKTVGAASAEIELTTITTTPFIVLTEGFKTLVPKILVHWKRDREDGNLKISEIVPSDELWTLKGLIACNHHDNSAKGMPKTLFLPLVIHVKKDGNILKKRAFDSECGSPLISEACRQRKAVFYPYRQGAMISFLEAQKIDIKLLKDNENSLKKWIDEAANDKLDLFLPMLQQIH